MTTGEREPHANAEVNPLHTMEMLKGKCFVLIHISPLNLRRLWNHLVKPSTYSPITSPLNPFVTVSVSFQC